MMRPDEIEDETRSQIGSEHRVSTQPRLLAIWDGGSSSCFLPPSGKVIDRPFAHRGPAHRFDLGLTPARADQRRRTADDSGSA